VPKYIAYLYYNNTCESTDFNLNWQETSMFKNKQQGHDYPERLTKAQMPQIVDVSSNH